MGVMSVGGSARWACPVGRVGRLGMQDAGPDLRSGPASGSFGWRAVVHSSAPALDAGVAALIAGDGLAGVGVDDGAGFADPAGAAAARGGQDQ